jgi:hypothetical protein
VRIAIGRVEIRTEEHPAPPPPRPKLPALRLTLDAFLGARRR